MIVQNLEHIWRVLILTRNHFVSIGTLLNATYMQCCCLLDLGLSNIDVTDIKGNLIEKYTFKFDLLDRIVIKVISKEGKKNFPRKIQTPIAMHVSTTDSRNTFSFEGLRLKSRVC